MILHIDTRGGSAAKDQKVIKVEVRDKPPKASLAKDGGKVINEMSEKNEYGSQVLLPLIFKLLQTSNPGLSSQFHTARDPLDQGIVRWKDLEGIEVETGPGSFTGLRVGVSVANALGFALGIPVNGKKIETDLQY